MHWEMKSPLQQQLESHLFFVALILAGEAFSKRQ
jgi:hypothetical protein